MSDKVIAILPGIAQGLLSNGLPDWVEPRFFMSKDEAMALATEAEIGWFDMYDKGDMALTISRATRMKWLNSVYAGVDGMPLELLAERGVTVTNGAGINAITIAEYVIMGMLTVAKGYRDVVHAQDRQQWLHDSPGKVELFGSKALLLGYGAIGKLIEERLNGFGVETAIVRRTPGNGSLGPDEWREKLSEFDWVILAVPATPETEQMIGKAELSFMKPSATLVNIARGSVVDQDALVAALREGRLGAAFLDVTDPEPLPEGHPLWSLDNAHITMHLSGRAQTLMFQRAGQRFLENLARYRHGAELEHRVDLALGY